MCVCVGKINIKIFRELRFLKDSQLDYLLHIL